jgi:tetratricopeptide (TPR) repeat protein
VSSLDIAQKRLAGVLQKRPGLALAIVGPPGIGKTHTVAAWLLQLPCAQQRFQASIAPGALLKSLLRPKTMSAWVAGTLEQVNAGAFVELPLLVSALGAIVAKLAPFVLHLEDAHELDADQLEFVLALAQAIKGVKGAALLVTSRIGIPEPFELVPLEPLPSEAVRLLLESEAGAGLPSECLALIDARAAGNPLFVLEFFRFLTRRGFVWNDGSCWHWRAPEHDVLPGTVEAVIERSILEACGDAKTRTVLEARAYLEGQLTTGLPAGAFDSALLAQVSGLDLASVRLAEHRLRSKGVLNEVGFVHPLFREVPVKTMTAQARQWFAQQAIAHLHHPSLASRFVKDAGLTVAQSRALLEAAIAEAEASGQTRLAYQLTVDALDLNLYDHAQQCRLGQRVAHYSLTKAARLFDQVNPQHPEDVYVWANILAQLGRLEDAQALLHNMPQDERQQIRWFECLLLVHSQANDHAGAVQIWDRHKDQMGHGSKFRLTVAHSLTLVSRLQEAHEVLEVVMGQATTDELLADALIVKGQWLVYTGDFEAAYAHGAQALNMYERLGDNSGMGVSSFGLGMLVYYHGQLDLAQKHFAKAKQLYFEVGNQTRYLQNVTMLCATQTELAQYEQAERGLLEAEEQLPNAVPSEVGIEICNNLSFLYRTWGISFGPMLALKYALKAVLAARQLNNPRLIVNSLYQASKSETLTGHPEEGLRLADEALQLAQSVHYAALIGYVQHARYQALKAMNRIPQAVLALEAGEAGCRSQNFLIDADFYAIELQCARGQWLLARELLLNMRRKGQVHRNNHALRLYPQLEEYETTGETTTMPAQARVPRLMVLGQMQVMIDGRSENVRGRKRQELLAFLLEARIAGRKEVHRLELLDAIYPEGYEAQSTSSLKELIRSVRSEYGTDVITTSTNGYALGTISSDAEDFLHKPDTQHWRGTYLESIRSASDNTQVSETLHVALLAQTKTQLETISQLDLQSALRASEILLGFDAYNLEHLELHLRALQANGKQKSIARAYAKSCQRLLEIGEHLPETWQAFLSVRHDLAQKQPQT